MKKVLERGAEHPSLISTFLFFSSFRRFLP